MMYNYGCLLRTLFCWRLSLPVGCWTRSGQHIHWGSALRAVRCITLYSCIGPDNVGSWFSADDYFALKRLKKIFDTSKIIDICTSMVNILAFKHIWMAVCSSFNSLPTLLERPFIQRFKEEIIDREKPISLMAKDKHWNCSSPRSPWVTYVIISEVCNFSPLILSLLFYQIMSSYQPFVIFSPFVIYSLFTLSTHPINGHSVHTTNTAVCHVLPCAHSLRQYIFLTDQASLAIAPFWYVGIETWLGVFSKS